MSGSPDIIPRMKLAIFCVPLFLAVPAFAQTPAISKEIESVYPDARAL
jgi:hypothetical protein